MIEFHAIRCPSCNSVVAEIAIGLCRVKCRSCKRRVWVASNGKATRIGMVDAAQKRLPDKSLVV